MWVENSVYRDLCQCVTLGVVQWLRIQMGRRKSRTSFRRSWRPRISKSGIFLVSRFWYMVYVDPMWYMAYALLCEYGLSAGGCGSMYEIVIDSEEFKGKRMLHQHRMINDVSHNYSKGEHS